LINSAQLVREMHNLAERRTLVTAIFAATGKKVDEDDPIIVAAIFQAHIMREASWEAASQIVEAGRTTKAVLDEVRMAVAEAGAVVRLAAADEKARSEIIDVLVKKALREAGRSQARQGGPQNGWPQVIAGVALGLFISAGVVSVACDFNFAFFKNARVGADFIRVMPTLEPSLRRKLTAQMAKQRQ
jgi:hypothetical protein